MTESPTTGPALDEVEFSAFGPGYGECLLVHMGGGDWMVVDSCVHAGRHPVLEYLQRLRVDVAEAVKLVVATHWHDDHVRGMADLLTACKGAIFACSDALQPDEVAAFARIPRSPIKEVPSGVQEMTETWRVVVERGGPAKWALQERELYRRPATEELPVVCRVHALSPSDDAVTRARRGIRELLEAAEPEADGSRRFGRIARPQRNTGAVVLCVDHSLTTPHHCSSMVLGADLQENPDRGWTSVLGTWGGRGRTVEVFKVPHHGSRNGHHAGVWTSMLTAQAHAVLCPHVKGSNRIPGATDLERLCGLTPNVHITAKGWRDPTRRSGKEFEPPAPFGQVTLRRRLSPNAPWTVAYSGAAGSACIG